MCRRLLPVLAVVIALACGGAAFITSKTAMPPQLPNSSQSSFVLYPIVQGFSGSISNPAQVLPGNRSWIWSTGNGASSFQISPVVGINSGGYWPFCCNNTNFNINGNYFDAKTHTVYWLLANHPDWLMYRCDEATLAYQARGYTSTVTNNSTSVTVTQANPNTEILVNGAGVFNSVGFPIDGTTINSTVTGTPGNYSFTVADKWTGSSGSVILYFNAKGAGAIALATAQSAVQQYVFGYLTQYLNGGFGNIDIDVANATNWGNQCGWFDGALTETNTVVSTANNGSGLIRVTVGSAITSGHFQTGSAITVSNVTSSPNAIGSFAGTLIDSTHIDLQGSTFDHNGTGGTVIYSQGTSPAFGGHWVQPYTGSQDAFSIDVNYAEHAVQWGCTISNFVHSNSSDFVVMNVHDIGFTVDNASSNEPAYSYEQKLAGCGDIIASESPVFSCKLSTPSARMCVYMNSGAFARYFVSQQQLSQQRSWWLVEYPPCRTDGLTGQFGGAYSCQTLGDSADQVYTTAIWLLLRGMATDPPSFWSPIAFLNNLTGTEHAQYIPLDATWQPALGTPTGRPFLDAVGGCYRRSYTHGDVVFNPAVGACTYTVPANSTDQFGTPIVAGSTSIAGQTALIAVTNTPN